MNRRQFIGAASAAGAFYIASEGRAFGANAASNRLRFAIVGCHEKGRGFEVMKKALENPGVEIAVVCDVDSRAMDFCADYLVKQGLPAPRKEKDFRKVLEMKDVDGVISETPDHFHAYSAVMAMRAGKHVYVEKPCAFCPQELDVIMQTWKKTGMVYQQGSQRRSIRSFIAAIAEIREKNLLGEMHYAKTWYNTMRAPIGRGRVCTPPAWLDWDLWQACAPREQFRDNLVHYNWHWFRTWGTGECGNNQVHFVDVARWMLGCDYPESIAASGGRFWMPDDQDWEWPDTHTFTYNFPGKKTIVWEGTCCSNAQPYMGIATGAMVYGTRGAVLFKPAGGVDLFDVKGKLVREWDATGVAKEAQITNTDNRSGGGWHDSTAAHFGNFADAIRANNPLMAAAHAEIATKSTYLALAGNVAYYAGGSLRVDPKNGRPIGNAEAEKLWSREYARGWELA